MAEMHKIIFYLFTNLLFIINIIYCLLSKSAQAIFISNLVLASVFIGIHRVFVGNYNTQAVWVAAGMLHDRVAVDTLVVGRLDSLLAAAGIVVGTVDMEDVAAGMADIEAAAADIVWAAVSMVLPA